MKVLKCTPIRAAACILPLLLSLLGTADLAAAQQPTPDQQSAIRANCRSDFMAKCSGVPRGGREALQCLKDNVATLSTGCQQAVNAIGGGAPTAPAAPAAPATPVTTTPAAPAVSPPPAAPATAATAPPSAPASSPAPAAPATAVTAPPAVSAAPAKSAATKQPSKAVAAPTASAPPAAAPVPPPVAATAPAPVGPPLLPRQKLFLLRTACGGDLRSYCPGVALGGGRVLDCLQANAASLSPSCQNALASLAR